MCYRLSLIILFGLALTASAVAEDPLKTTVPATLNVGILETAPVIDGVIVR